jgi:flagellar hook-associated protein 2
MSITIAGSFSGLNVSSIISTIIAADSIPITNLQTEDTKLTTQSTDLGNLGTSLGELSLQLQNLGSSTLFSSKSATLSNTTVGTAAADSTAGTGSVSVNVTQLATATTLRGGLAGGAFADDKLTSPPAGTTLLSSALDESNVNGEVFTINGKQITLSSSDVIDDGNPNSTNSVIGLINNSGAGVTASYNSTTGAVSLQSNSSSPIILGASTDTSDFLQQAELFNNGTGTVNSATGLGRIDENTDLSTAGLRTTPTTGTFTVNGVSIQYDAGDTLTTIMNKINTSGAGVTATYDSYEDQMVLTSNTLGGQNITVANGTSNLASALRLTSSDSQLEAGQSTLFTVGNDPTVRQSNSNVISATALGIQGVTLTATSTGSTTITVQPDVTSIAAAINAFVTQYNSTQTTIASLTQVNVTDADADGPLATDTNLTFLAPQLRQATTNLTTSSGVIRMLSDLGVESNANDNTLTQVDTTDLQNALTNDPSQVESLFNDPLTGLTNTIQNVLEAYNDSLNGVIANEQSNISTEITFNKAQITRMQEQITVEQTTLENEFAALDQIQGSSQGLAGILSSSNGTTTASTSSSSSGLSSIGTVGGSSSSSSTSSSS